MKVELKCNKETAPCNNLCFAIGVLGGKCAVANVKNEEMLSSLVLFNCQCSPLYHSDWQALGWAVQPAEHLPVFLQKLVTNCCRTEPWHTVFQRAFWAT